MKNTKAIAETGGAELAEVSIVPDVRKVNVVIQNLNLAYKYMK